MGDKQTVNLTPRPEIRSDVAKALLTAMHEFVRLPTADNRMLLEHYITEYRADYGAFHEKAQRKTT